ncbi:hypothetical protein PLUTE_a5261 [Pseudoalteromonas luteoviolacea DSM 6061]|nr:hypothetical protein [Pseudoalteromonas luteoviolacea DSM 6061]
MSLYCCHEVAGARLNNSLALANKNRKFFPEFEDMCTYLESLTHKV